MVSRILPTTVRKEATDTSENLNACKRKVVQERGTSCGRFLRTNESSGRDGTEETFYL